jgi:multidrug efflux pump subunit AcrA (membrane-fusion protein)
MDRVQKGSFKATVTETGELLAVSSKVINPRFWQFWIYGKAKIVALEEEGTLVKKGDFLAQFDTSNVARKLKESRAELEIAKADYEKLIVEQTSEIRKLEAQLETAKAALRLAVVDTQSVLFESPVKRKKSRIEYFMNELEVKKIERKINHTREIQKEDLLIQKAKIDKSQRAIETAKVTIDNFTLWATADGMIEYRRKRREKRKISIGDEIFPWESVIGLPDLSRMKVLAEVNESDISKIKLGQKTEVRLDAFPKVAFDGNIIFISKTCRRKERDSDIKIFDIEVLLDKSDPILRPGMTVSCEIAFAELEDVFHVPLAYIQEEKDGYFVYIKRGLKQRRIPVKLGPRNAKRVVIYGAVEDDDKLVFPEQEEDA